MTRYQKLAMSLLLSAALLLVSVLGPAQVNNNWVQILEFGTSTSFAETTKDNPTSIEVQGTNPQTATPLTTANEPFANGQKTDAQTPAASEATVASTAKAVVQPTTEERAKAISEGTPLDYKSALILLEYAEEYDLNPSLILSVIEVESNFNQWEVGSSKDRGFMQIIPSTEKWLAKDFGKEIGLSYNPERIFDPEYNIGLAAAYLNLLKENYGDNYDRILSEYNRGPSNLKRYYQKHGTYSTSYSRKVLAAQEKYLAFNK